MEIITMTSENELQILIVTFGKENEDFIRKAIEWLDCREELWNLDKPVCREDYIRDLLSRVRD
jgi:hypothetical protein